MNITYITGNPGKAAKFNELIDLPIQSKAIDLPEIQSLDLHEIIEHKVKTAYEIVGSPVIVEDTSLTFTALNKLPGPYIKWFIDSLSFQQICDLVPENNREAVSEVLFAYYDGENLHVFSTTTKGTIPKSPAGEVGFGWDPIFIPDGFDITRAQMSVEDNTKYYHQAKPFAQLSEFLKTLEV